LDLNIRGPGYFRQGILQKKTLNIDDNLGMGWGMCIGICPENPGALWLEDKRTGEVIWDGVGMVRSFKKKDVGGYSLA
jgi:hypothetical protein